VLHDVLGNYRTLAEMAHLRYGVIKRSLQVETRVPSNCPVCAVGLILMQHVLKLHLSKYSLQGDTSPLQEVYKK